MKTRRTLGRFAQKVVGAAAHYHAALVAGELLDYLRLEGEEVQVARELVAVGRQELAGVHLVGRVEELHTVHVLVRGAEQVLGDSAPVGGHADQLVVVKRYSQSFGGQFSYCIAAAAVLP